LTDDDEDAGGVRGRPHDDTGTRHVKRVARRRRYDAGHTPDVDPVIAGRR
jgi:hypothetical protein